MNGGANGYGAVFSLSVGLGPFVETKPSSGKVGVAVKVLGTNLIGATSVTFNGTAAAFTVKSKSEITTTVPVSYTHLDVYKRQLCSLPLNVELHLAADDVRQCPQMPGEYDLDHGSVCTSTDSTPGRCSAIEVQVSPASDEALSLIHI